MPAPLMLVATPNLVNQPVPIGTSIKKTITLTGPNSTVHLNVVGGGSWLVIPANHTAKSPGSFVIALNATNMILGTYQDNIQL